MSRVTTSCGRSRCATSTGSGMRSGTSSTCRRPPHRRGTRQPGYAGRAMVSGRDAELRDRGVPARQRRTHPALVVAGEDGRRTGRGRGCSARPRRSRPTCAGWACSRVTGSSGTCRTSARPSSRSSERPAWARRGRCAIRTSRSAVWWPGWAAEADRVGGQRRFSVRRKAPRPAHGTRRDPPSAAVAAGYGAGAAAGRPRRSRWRRRGDRLVAGARLHLDMQLRVQPSPG